MENVRSNTIKTIARVVSWLALLAAAALAVLLGVRQMGSVDIGYHLAYGEEFWRTGRPVDHNPFLFTLTPHGTGDSDDLAPGCWYDDQGRYRFPNANWGTQVILAAVHTHLGEAALMWMLPLMIAAIVVLLLLLTMRRLGLSPLAAAAGLMLFAMAAYERFILRPEMFSYVLLAGQLFVLVGWRGRVRQIVALGVLQLLLVNVHSYFLLGLALTGAFTLDALPRRRKIDASPRLRVPASCLPITLAIQTVLCFANPWTWRSVVMPFQTLLFMRKNAISGQYGPTDHPWSIIGEFSSPFHTFANVHATATYYVLLVLTFAAACVLLWRLWRGTGVPLLAPGEVGSSSHNVQAYGTHNAGETPAPRLLAWLLILAGMTVVSLSMRRNIAPFALLTPPLVMAVLTRWRIGGLATRLQRLPDWLRPVPALAILTLAVALAGQIPNNRLYVAENVAARFGLTYATTEIPLAACEFLSTTLALRDGDRVWCDYNTASSVHYYTRPHPDVPLLTNTWAYPPSVMRMVLHVSWTPDGQPPTPLAGLYERFGFQIVLLRVEGMTWALAHALARDHDWALVYADARYVIFVRRDGHYGPRLADLELTPARMATCAPALLERARAQDPSGAALYGASVTLNTLGYREAATAAIRQAIELRPISPYYNRLGQLLAMRANEQAARRKYYDARQLLQQAVEAFETAVKLDKNNTIAKGNLENARGQLQMLESGRPIVQVPETM